MGVDTDIGMGIRVEHDASDHTGAPDWQLFDKTVDITPPSDNPDVLDITTNQSPNRTREYMLGAIDPGELGFSFHFQPGQGGDLVVQNMRANRRTEKLRLVFPNGAVWEFEGLLTNYVPDIPTTTQMEAQVSFKVTGSYAIDYSGVAA